MPDVPDFEQIARVAVMTFYNTTPRHSDDEREAVAQIVARLRQVWNARGAADADLVGGTAVPGDSLRIVAAAIRGLDR